MRCPHASAFFLSGIVLVACGGRIAQGSVDTQSETTTRYALCGSVTCGTNEECCVGGSLEGNANDPTAQLEACVPSGTCNTGLVINCWGQCDADSVCCLTVNPSTMYATAGCSETCGGNGLPAVQFCATDDDCPAADKCFTASDGPNGEGETVDICGGVR